MGGSQEKGVLGDLQTNKWDLRLVSRSWEVELCYPQRVHTVYQPWLVQGFQVETEMEPLGNELDEEFSNQNGDFTPSMIPFEVGMTSLW